MIGLRAFAIFSVAIAFVNAASAEQAPNSSEPGAHAVSTGEYKFPAEIDPSVLSAAKTELWARAWWPTDLAPGDKRPIAFLLHGNHSTCGHGSAPRIDNSCSYTSTGECSEGDVPVPNHEGYAYFAQTLASHGIVVVSINANRGITCSSGGSGDWGLNMARGRLILRHMEEWSKWSRDGGAPDALGAPATFQGAIDWTRVGLFGHSRGGEGARAAYNFYLNGEGEWRDKIPGASILAVFEIGAVDGQTSRTFDAMGAAWNQILPMCDGDVSDLEGRMPFERMLASSADEPQRSPKSLTMVWGANHNFFNSEWQRSDSYGCVAGDPLFANGDWNSERQQAIARELAVAFFRAHLNGEAQYRREFDTLWSESQTLTQAGRVDRDFAPFIDRTLFAPIDDFDKATGTSTSGATNDVQLVTVENERYKWPRRAHVRWNQPDANAYLQTNWSASGDGKSAAGFSALSVRVARPGTESSKAPSDFSVALVDAVGGVSKPVLMSQFVAIDGPGNSTVTFQTARIPLATFAGVDLSRLVGVRFIFDRGDAGGEIYLANVRLSQAPEGVAVARREPRFTPATVGVGAPPTSTANWVAAKSSANSRWLSGQDAVDVTVQAVDAFPARDSLPCLAIGDRVFKGGRYAANGKLDKLTFSIPRADWEKLPEGAAVRVQYGPGPSPSAVWNVKGAFSKNK